MCIATLLQNTVNRLTKMLCRQPPDGHKNNTDAAQFQKEGLYEQLVEESEYAGRQSKHFSY